MVSLQDKVILVTGASGGLGRSVASRAALTGAHVALSARHPESLRALVSDLGLSDDRTLIYAADLADASDAHSLVAAVEERWGSVDVLLNLVGGWRPGVRLAEVSDADWDAVLDLNLRSAFNINRAVVGQMARRGWGRIVNIAARAAVHPGARSAPYNVAKAGVVALTASIAADYRKQGVVAVAVLPGTIDTPANRQQMPDADTSRWVTPESLGELLLFLCGKEAEALNGSSISAFGP